MTVAARFLSWIFLPLSAPVIALALVAFLPAYNVPTREVIYLWDEQWKYVLLLMFGFFSVLVPGFAILFMRVTGVITTVMMEKRHERLLPALIVNVSAIALYIILALKDPEGVLASGVYALSIGSLLTVSSCTIITRWWKISLHAAGMGILSGFLFAYYSHYLLFEWWVLPLSLAVSGLVMSARMYLGAHDLAQCLAGFAVGFVCLAGSVWFLFPV